MTPFTGSEIELKELVREMLIRLGEEPDREGLVKTPERVEKALQFLTSGYQQDVEKGGKANYGFIRATYGSSPIPYICCGSVEIRRSTQCGAIQGSPNRSPDSFPPLSQCTSTRQTRQVSRQIR